MKEKIKNQVANIKKKAVVIVKQDYTPLPET
jgi:hypothetical protein